MCVDHTTPRYSPTEFNIATCLTCFLSFPKQAFRMMVEKNNVLSLHLKHNQVTVIKATHVQKGNGRECQASHYWAGKDKQMDR